MKKRRKLSFNYHQISSNTHLISYSTVISSFNKAVDPSTDTNSNRVQIAINCLEYESKPTLRKHAHVKYCNFSRLLKQ